MKRITSLIVIALFTLSFTKQDYNVINYNSLLGIDSSAVYNEIQDDQYLNNWLIIGPIAVSDKKLISDDQGIQVKAFENEPLAPADIYSSVKNGKLSYNGINLEWKPVKAENNIVTIPYKESNYQICYAYAEIIMAEAKDVLLGVGSDDAIKIWVNSELVHKNYIARGVQADNDLVPFKLKKGINQILLKVQNMELGWGFACHIIGKNSLTENLIENSSKGNLDAVKVLLSSGVDVNAQIKPGYTALHAAQLAGRKGIVDYLIQKGADQTIRMPAKDDLADAYFNKFVKDNYPGAAVLVSRDGKIIYQNAFGFADIENKKLIINDSKFRIGSITKQFTSAAILKLQEKGLLSTSDHLSKYIPDFPRGDEVTIHHLLTHTSGIHNFTNVPIFIMRVGSPITLEDLIKEIIKEGYDFNPGEKYSYCNSGYVLLGYIIEKVSGLSYGDYLAKSFFEPLGMENSGVYNNKSVPANEAKGYAYGNNKILPALNWDMSWAGGAGALYSTTKDLYIWNEALFSGKVINEETRKAAFTPAATKENPAPGNTGYGYGWSMSLVRGVDIIGHSGGLHGFSSNLIRLTDLNATVVVLLNCVPAIPGLDASTASEAIAQIYFGSEMVEQETMETKKDISVKVLEKYAGQYQYPGAVLTVSVENGRIFAQLTGQGKAEIFPKSEYEYFWKVVDAQVTFIMDEAGNVTGAKHKQNGQEFPAPKIENKDISAGVYQKYAGKYQYPMGAVLTVSIENKSMFAQLSGQDKYELFPQSETEFSWKIVDAQITFIMDEAGNVTGAKHKQNGQEFPVSKIKEEEKAY